MSVFIDALRPHILPALYEVKGPSGRGLLNAIETGAYTPSHATTTALTLSFHDPATLAAIYAADAARFASASFETMMVAGAGLDSPLGCGWCMVQLYYSAFYAAHATVRLLGSSCSHFTAATAARLSRLVGAVGLNPAPTLGRGMYVCSVTGGDVEVTAASGAANGGSHEIFWRHFARELDALVPRILSGPLPTVDAQDVVARLVDIRSTLSTGASQPDWLTRLRNEVQYRQGHGLWYPHRLRVDERRRLAKLLADWQSDDPRHNLPPAAGVGDLPEFVSACAFLTSVCRILVLDLSQRAPRKGRSFVDFGAAKLLRVQSV